MRPTRQQMFMEIAHVVAKRSTCNRLNVGAIVVQGNRIVSIGYNGQMPGDPHCDTVCQPGQCNTIHAETNALKHIPLDNDLSDGLDLYVTDSPCMACASLLASYGIARVFYQSPYRLLDPILTLLQRGIEVYRVFPNGQVINQRTDQIEHALR